MKLILIALFISLPYFSFSQDFKIKIGDLELPTDSISEDVDFPQRIDKFKIKKKKRDNNPVTHIVQVGEEEHSFLTNGEYNDITFTHDIKDLAIFILNERRAVQGKPFKLKKRK
jgi:hypothetical protein